jgi:hypothetical protein
VIREHSPNSRAARAVEDRWLNDPEFIAVRAELAALPAREARTAKQSAEARRLIDLKWSIIERVLNTEF